MESRNDLLIRQYRQDVANLDVADGLGTEEDIVQVRRETIAWEEWTSTEDAQIRQIDDLLVAHWEQFADIPPSEFYRDRTHWWWFLHEGPQVREEARRIVEKEKATHALA